MKKFEIFRYLKRFSALIFLMAVAGAIMIYMYAQGKQQYTASLIIKYTNEGIKDGFTPDGRKLDVNEIYSSAVISQAIDSLGSSGKLNVIRSNCKVDEVIPDEQEKINEALIEKGEEVTYFPDTYKVSLVVSGKEGGNYARNMLDAIMQSYCTYYTENYIEQRLSLNPSSNLLESGYDYYECIRILEDDTNAMLQFLEAKKENYPKFRSSKTRYRYSDLYDIYVDFKKYTIPELYAKVLNGPQVRDGEVLRKFLANSITTSNQQEAVETERRQKIDSLIQQYVEKNTGILESYFTEDGENVSSSYILKEIEEAGSGEKAETTYDGLILEMVGIDEVIAADQIDRAFLDEILMAFESVGSGSSGTEEEHAEMERLINDYENQLEKYYEIVNISSKELNLYISADYLKMVSSVRVAPSINIKLYSVIALVFFFIVGCCGAIVLGRTSDIVDYLLYTDKKSGLPNREKLNVYIDDMAKRILPEDFTCFSLQLDNLSELSKRFGYTVGDGMLRDFSGLVQLMGDTDGMVGYNGVGKFVAFFDECSDKKAKVILKILDSQVEEYNKLNPEYPIKYTASWSTTTEVGMYEIRELLRSAQSKIRDLYDAKMKARGGIQEEVREETPKDQNNQAGQSEEKAVDKIEIGNEKPETVEQPESLK